MSPRLPEGIHLVLDAHVCAAAGRRPADVACAAVEAGVRLVQVRAKHTPVRELVALTVDVARALAGRGIPLVVDDRVDVVLAARSRGVHVDGVHVGQSDLEAADARALLGPDALVGVSAATADHLRAVVLGTVDYVGVGPVRSTLTKADAGAPVGFAAVRDAAQGTGLPVVAIGGLGVDDVPDVQRSGGAAVAVISAICAARDPRAAAADLVAAWDRGDR